VTRTEGLPPESLNTTCEFQRTVRFLAIFPGSTILVLLPVPLIPDSLVHLRFWNYWTPPLRRGPAVADDPESVDRALEGAYGAYFVTFFWDHFNPEKETQPPGPTRPSVPPSGMGSIMCRGLGRDSETLGESRSSRNRIRLFCAGSAPLVLLSSHRPFSPLIEESNSLWFSHTGENSARQKDAGTF